jgi:hypothetical protein
MLSRRLLITACTGLQKTFNLKNAVQANSKKDSIKALSHGRFNLAGQSLYEVQKKSSNAKDCIIFEKILPFVKIVLSLCSGE